MKRFEILAYQTTDSNDMQQGLTTSIDLSIDLDDKEEFDIRKLTYTVITELFHWFKLQTNFKSKGLKLSEPVHIKTSFDGYSFDTMMTRKSLIEKFKLNKTAKFKRSFAKKCFLIFQETLRSPEYGPKFDDKFLNTLEDGF